MPRTVTFSVRLEPEVRDALERAARDDERSMTNYVRMVLVRHLREAGYLTETRG